MQNSIINFTLFISCIFSNVLFASADVTLSGVHLCCISCQDAVEQAVGSVTGASVQVNRDNKTVSISANDDTIAQKAVDAVVKAGFYGKSSREEVSIKTSDADGTSENLTMTGFHNCCGSCSSALESSISNIKGVTGVRVNKNSCNVKGRFDVLAVLKAANNAGFSATIR